MNIKDFIDQKILPVLYLLFILAGLTASLISGVIEYDIFRILFNKTGASKHWVVIIPLLMVFSFEVVKLFLVFFLNRFKGDLGTLKYLSALRRFLVFVSIVSTVMFTIYQLHAPNLDKIMFAKKQDVMNIFNSDIKELKENFREREVSATQSVNTKIDRINEEQIKERQVKYNGIWRGTNYKGLETDYSNFISQKDKILSDLSNERIVAIRELEEKRDKKLSSLEQDLPTSFESDNEIISAVLSVFYSGFGNTTNYPRGMYTMVILILSLLIGLGLEFVILSTFTVVAVDAGVLPNSNIDLTKMKPVIAGFIILVIFTLISSFTKNSELSIWILIGILLAGVLSSITSSVIKTENIWQRNLYKVLLSGSILVFGGIILGLIRGENYEIDSFVDLIVYFASGSIGGIISNNITV